MRELIAGTAFKPSTAALMKKDMKPSFTVFFFVKASCDFLRSSITAVMSHSLNVVKMAAVCCAITSWAAILRRSGDIFLRVKRPVSAEAGEVVSAISVAGAAPRSCTAASTSPFVRRPPFPVPVRWAVCSFSSSTIRRTAGDKAAAFGDFFSPLIGASVRLGSGFSLTSSGVATVAVAAVAGAEGSIVATTSPIFTSWPSVAIVFKTPALSAAISVETLSVSRVKRMSPALTCSPSFLCQTETTPLEMDSPTAGILTSMLMDALQYA